MGIGMPRSAIVTRVSKATRDKIIKAASRAFARDGYEGASVRAIVAAAENNLPREAALRRFVRQQLRPMTARDELSEYVRIFNWETLKPSPIFRKFMAREAAPFFAIATGLVRRFLPNSATDKQAVVGALWLFGQCSIFVRNAEQLANPPLRLKIDERFVDGLADTIATWAAAGLGKLPTPTRP